MKFLLLSMLMVVSLNNLNAQNSLISVYQFELPSLNGGDNIKLSDFKGKKILIINIASQSDSINQLKSVLRFLRRDSLDNVVLILCPSNSFNHEEGSIQLLRRQYKIIGGDKIKITAPLNVNGEQAHPLFKWFTSAKENGAMNAKVYDDFNKFIIDEKGAFTSFLGKTQSPDGAMIKKVLKKKQ
jgi:glutathione peroxidase